MDLEKYQEIYQRDKATPEDIYEQVRLDGHNLITAWQILMTIFDLSLPDAKEIAIKSDRIANSLSDYQEGLIEPINKVLEDKDTIG